MYRYYLRQVIVGDGRRPARTPLREAQEQAGVPAGQWMGRGLAVFGLAPGEEVTESQLRNLFGERGRHPYADRIKAEELAARKSPKPAVRAGALGRRVTVTGFDLVFRPQPTIYLLWALGDEETRRVIEAAHERAIERVLEWSEDESAVIRYGKDGIYKVRPPGGLVAARFRHYEARIQDAVASRPCAAVGEGAATGREVGVNPLRGRVGEHGRRVLALQRDRGG